MNQIIPCKYTVCSRKSLWRIPASLETICLLTDFDSTMLLTMQNVIKISIICHRAKKSNFLGEDNFKLIFKILSLISSGIFGKIYTLSAQLCWQTTGLLIINDSALRVRILPSDLSFLSNFYLFFQNLGGKKGHFRKSFHDQLLTIEQHINLGTFWHIIDSDWTRPKKSHFYRKFCKTRDVLSRF